MYDDKTCFINENAGNGAALLVFDATRRPVSYKLSRHMTLGRRKPDSVCNITVVSAITGSQQGEFIYNDFDDSYYYCDNDSKNGTYVNGRLVRGRNHPVKLSDGDIIRIDHKILSKPHDQAVLIIFSKSIDFNSSWNQCMLSPGSVISIGRDSTNNIVINDITASRRHATISNSDNGILLYDNNSQNGTSVNGYDINKVQMIYDHDVILIGRTVFVVIGNMLFYNDKKENKGSLIVNIDKKTVGVNRKVLIRDIRFEAEYGDFVLILGSSGAGKTTLINAILGDGKADGKVILDGKNLYDNFKTMKSQLGIVPQFLTLRLNDTVKNTLMDVADVKMDKRQYSKADKQKMIDEILEKVGVSGLKNHLIRQLSGGQKKKVSVATQLVGFQKVFICDEPDSGLDPASRIQQMEILKEVSQNNKIVMVISHGPNDAINTQTGETLFTKVLVIAKSSKDNAGHLAFFGPVNNALSFFGVQSLQDIVLKINPKHEGGQGLADLYIDKYNSLNRRV